MILLDTHVLIWLDQDSSDLGARCRAAVDSALADDALAVSAISFWEVAMLAERNRLTLDRELGAWHRDLLLAGIRELTVDGSIGIRAASLAGLHSDPADRMIAATAQMYGATLATADRRLLDWQTDLPASECAKVGARPCLVCLNRPPNGPNGRVQAPGPAAAGSGVGGGRAVHALVPGTVGEIGRHRPFPTS